MNKLTEWCLEVFTILLVTIFLNVTVNAMSYSTDTDLYDRVDSELVIQLTDDAGTGEVDQAKVDNLRADCTELINTHLRGRYVLPLQNTPAILVTIEADLLVHKLYTRRAGYELPDSVKDLKKDALKTLEMISKGTIKLEEQPDPGETQIATNKSSSVRIFSDEKLTGFR